MNNYKIEEYEIPLIWAQKAHKQSKVDQDFEPIGEPIGPFLTGAEASRALEMKHLGNPASVLSGKKLVAEGYHFYYEGAKKLTSHIPNVKYAKENNLLNRGRKHTKETILNDFLVSGFNTVIIGEVVGTKTKAETKCCIVECSNIVKKRHDGFILNEQIPYCKECSAIIYSAVTCKQIEQKSFLDVRPDLAEYYHSADNKGIEMNEISHGSRKKVYLKCNVCNTLQSEKDAGTPNLYTSQRVTGSFHRVAFCKNCANLAGNYPELAEQWHEKNEKSIYDYAQYSQTRVWWKCSEGHEWKAVISTRTMQNADCPHCTGSKGEKVIGNMLEELNIDFQTQFPALINEVRRRFDFYLPEHNLYIEVHGGQHFETNEYFKSDIKVQRSIDKQKQDYAEKHGHYMMISYQEHNSKLTVERFLEQFSKFLKHDKEVA